MIQTVWFDFCFLAPRCTRSAISYTLEMIPKFMHACASSALFECMAKNPIRTRARSYTLPAAFEPGVMMMISQLSSWASPLHSYKVALVVHLAWNGNAMSIQEWVRWYFHHKETLLLDKAELRTSDSRQYRESSIQNVTDSRASCGNSGRCRSVICAHLGGSSSSSSSSWQVQQLVSRCRPAAWLRFTWWVPFWYLWCPWSRWP